MNLFSKYFFCAILAATAVIPAYSSRIKDIATIEGVSGSQVVGYGLVTGLSNTGDTQQSRFTMQSVANMLKRFGITVPAQINGIRSRNVAAVMVTAIVPPFSRKGGKIDVQVSSIGDARSLQGGILIMTPLSDADGSVVGMAQGGVSVGGYDFQADGSRVGRNFTASGRVPGGVILERESKTEFIRDQLLRVVLRDPDFTTSSRVADGINRLQSLANAATAIDAATIEVKLPAGQNPGQITGIISQIENLQVTAEPAARVVINERTGTVVVGGAAQLLPAVVAHGGLEVQIQRVTTQAPQAPFTVSAPKPVQNSTITTEQEKNQPVLLPATTTVQDMAAALTLLKVTPRDLIAIFQALKEAGSLQGELIIQ